MLRVSPRLRRPVGIDLGTTNSVIALLDDTGTVLQTGVDPQSGAMTFPSLVGWDAAGGRIVAGREARQRSAASDTLPLASVKRCMGLDRRFPLGPQTLAPEEASAIILRGLRDWMAQTLRDPRRLLDQAIITMPAYFNHNQIEATRRAGELAGYTVVELLHEPTAAAIYYSWLLGHGDATYLVYDLGGGTFDVSLIRRRLNDYEVLSVSGDPFLGGDDFDRLLATHLLETGTWRCGDAAEPPPDLPSLFDPTQPRGAAPFARLTQLAETIKVELSARERVERFVPRVLTLPDGRELSLEVTVTKSAFERLIRDKVERTIACCHEALGRARERAGLRLGDVDHVVLVGGSSRVPLVRRLVEAAFVSPELSEHTRSAELLLHEPDLCVAYGAALRAAGHGTRHLFTLADEPPAPEVELHVTSPGCSAATTYSAAGVVRVHGVDPAELLDGASVRVRALTTGLIEEAFLDAQGGFAAPVELLPEQDNPIEWTFLDPTGQERCRTVTPVRHSSAGRTLGRGMLATQLITRPLAIDVLTRGRQRVRQVVAPVGAPLPATFRCTCRTSDQSGRIVVPICEDHRVIKQLVIEGIDRSLPVGSPVEVDLAIDVRHTITVAVRVRGPGGNDHVTTARIEPPPPPARPTRQEIDAVLGELHGVLDALSGRLRSRYRARVDQVHADLLEALSYDDEPRAIQRMAELRDLLARAEQTRDEALDPPWPRFAGLVRDCLDLAARVAQQTDRDADELLQPVHAQERYAEQAYEEHNQPLYRECCETLEKYAGYLAQLLRDELPRQAVRPTRPPEEEARLQVERFREQLARVWKQARQAGRGDLDTRLAEIARQASTFSQRMKAAPLDVLREARRLEVEIDKVRLQMEQPARPQAGDGSGLLEGSS